MPWRTLLALLALLAFYLVDLWTPIGLTLPVCYIIALVLVIALPQKVEKVLAAGTCTMLIVIDSLASPRLPTTPAWVYFINHGLAIPILWIVALRNLLYEETERALRESEERYRTLYEQTPSMYFSVDHAGTVRAVNQFGAGQLGYTPDQLVGRSVLEVFFEEDKRAVAEHLAQAFQNPTRVNQWEFRKVRKDGSLLWVREWVRIVKDHSNVPRAFIVCEDITDRKRSEQALKESERVANERLGQLKSIYASAPVGLCFVDRELRFVSMNDTLAKMHGRPSTFYLGRTVGEATPDIARDTETRCREVIDTGRPILDVEVRGAGSSRPGEKRYWLASYHPVKDGLGSVLGVNLAIRDGTYRKQAEADTLFLLDVGECIRFAADAEEMNWVIGVALGEHLEASRSGFADLDATLGRLTVRRDYRRHAPSLAGEYSLQNFSPAILEEAKAGRTVVVNDTIHDERARPHAEMFNEAGIRSFIAAPLLRDGLLASFLFVAAQQHREWSEREIALVNAVAERTWLAAERLKLVHALRESEVALRAADRRKDEFLATLAHELRNPLGLIRNVVSLLQSPSATEAEVRWGRDIIDRQVSYLTRLTDDLFDVSRITRDKLELRKEEVQVAEIISGAAESCRPLMKQRGHEFTLSLPATPIFLLADKIRLTQAIMNLLNNAAKYTPTGGRIALAVEQVNNGINIRVKDSGIGIAEADLNRVFDLFFQADRSFARAEGGLGLGLTLVNRLVAMHGGTVKVESAGLNQGSEFIVHLPVIAPPVAALPDRHSQDNGKTPAKQRRRVLVADDFPESAQLLARLLRQSDNEVRVALDGLEAVEIAAQFQPNIILLDIAMPKLDGYEVANKIRQQPWGQKAILIALTGWGQQKDRRRTKEAGFDVHLTKPINYQTINKLLDDLSGDADGQEVGDSRLSDGAAGR